jgi:hypothetical protein
MLHSPGYRFSVVLRSHFEFMLLFLISILRPLMSRGTVTTKMGAQHNTELRHGGQWNALCEQPS